MAFYEGNYIAELTSMEESLAIMRELQHGSGVAESLDTLARVACEQDDYSAARQMFQQGLAIRRERGDRNGMAASLAGSHAAQGRR